MTQAIAQKLIKRMKAGTIYGIFEKADQTETYYSMQLTANRNIDIIYYGGYCIPCTKQALADWSKWADHKKLYLKPVRLSSDYVKYKEI